MFSRIFYGSSQCRLVLMVSFFASLFMLSGLSPVRDFQSDHQKGQTKKIIDQRVAFRIEGDGFKEIDTSDDTSGDFLDYSSDYSSDYFFPSFSIMEGKGIQKNATDGILE